MLDWTGDARAAFEDYCRRIRPRLTAEGADPDEVFADLRSHIERDAAAAGSTLISLPAIQHALARIGEPEPLAAVAVEDNPQPPAGAESLNRSKPEFSAWSRGLLMVFGVILPFVTIAIEAVTHICAADFFDPIPTWGHLALVTLVPAVNLVLLMTASGRLHPPLRLLGFMSWMTIAIAGYYSILFAPLAVLGVVAIIAYGLGLLPLAPICSLITAVKARRRASLTLGISGAPARLGGLWGIAAALALFALLDIHPTLTGMAMDRAANSTDEAVRARAIGRLRAFGDEKSLRDACYGRIGSATALWGRVFYKPLDHRSARRLYYQVTGRSHVRRPRESWQLDAGREFDSELLDLETLNGGEMVGPVFRQLALAGSRLDGSVAPDAALGYLEWTMEFRNSGDMQMEARAQLQLPPGGAVSRLTLWVGGQEREAVFAGKGAVRAAYQQVAVRERRDPVLVTTSGPDQVMVQCFPVPAHGSMKIRLGISFPLALADAGRCAAILPRIVDRNFEIGNDAKHAVWVESRQPLESGLAGTAAENPKPQLFAVRGQVKDDDLGGQDAVVWAGRRDLREAWAPDPVTSGSIVRQRVESQTSKPPSCVAFVIDGSAPMREAAAPIADAVAALPGGIEIAVILAGDKPEAVQPPAKADTALLAKAAAAIRNHEYAGGTDNLPALLAAWDIAARRPDGVIVWLHGRQPITLSVAEPLIQGWDRRPGETRLVAFAAVPGFNRLLRELDGRPEVESAARLSTVSEDLKTMLATLTGAVPRWVATRERVDPSAPRAGEAASTHLARLWALDESRRLLARAKPDSTRQALELAARYRIVTPVTGAVVLENDAQYKQTGLKPPEAAGIPVLPEPGEWALIGVCVMALILAWAYRRRQRCDACA